MNGWEEWPDKAFPLDLAALAVKEGLGPGLTLGMRDMELLW